MKATDGGGTASETESCDTRLGLRRLNPIPPATDYTAAMGAPATPVPIPVPIPSSKRWVRIGEGDGGSDGLGPGVTLSLPRLSHYTLGLMNFPYDRLGPVLGIPPLPIGRPQALPNIFPLPKQVIEPPFNLHGRLFLIPPDLPVIPICDRFAALGLVDGGGNLGPKFSLASSN